MKYFLFIVCFTISISACLSNNANSDTLLTDALAETLLNDYVTSIKDNDKEKVKSYWHHKSASAKGFWLMNYTRYAALPFEYWPRFVSDHDISIISIENKDDYTILVAQWKNKENPEAEKMEKVFYLINEDGKWLFIRPLELFTRDWKVLESKYLTIHYNPDYDIISDSLIIKQLDKDIEHFCDIFDYKPENKIHYYKASDATEC